MGRCMAIIRENSRIQENKKCTNGFNKFCWNSAFGGNTNADRINHRKRFQGKHPSRLNFRKFALNSHSNLLNRSRYDIIFAIPFVGCPISKVEAHNA